MNARKALTMIEYQVQDDYDICPELHIAIATLSAALGERERFDKRCAELWGALCQTQKQEKQLRVACEAIIREYDPDTCTKDWPSPEAYCEFMVEQALAALRGKEGEDEVSNGHG